MAYLGIDTSNYTTSCALAKDGKILADLRKLLSVKEGGLGLRQSDALFQHWENLPELLKIAFETGEEIEGIIVSIKPRPQDGSYMPVFNAGKAMADTLSSALHVPVTYRSHQEGHILSASYGNNVDYSKPIVCAHLSGGTLELVNLVNGKFSIVGATKDISYGQLIDRVGVMMGLSFPAGKYVDELALECDSNLKSPIKKIFVDNTELNISGFETQIKSLIDEKKYSNNEIAYFVMKAISDSFITIINNTNIKQVLVTGGVASSKFLRRECEALGYIFGKPELCSDNSVGLALSEGNLPW